MIYPDDRKTSHDENPQMKSLKPPNSHHLSAAIGWLGLGNWREANEELENIAPELRAHPSVLLVRHEVYAKAGKWDLAAELATAIRKINPDEPGVWIALSYAMRRKSGGGVAAAKKVLVEAQQLFPNEAIIAYNLACYECQLGNRGEAWKWLESAFDLGDAKKLKLMALEDPDLEKFWEEIGEI